MTKEADLGNQDQIKKMGTPNKLLPHLSGLPWRILASLALALSSCSTPLAQNPVEKPPETAPIPGESEPQLALQTFEINQGYPEELKPYIDVFGSMAAKDNLNIKTLSQFDVIQAKDEGISVEYALMPIALVHNLTDPDGQPSNPKPVYYMAYKDEQEQVRGAYLLGKIIEQDKEGNVTYVDRILAENTFRIWFSGIEPENGLIDMGQIVSLTPLKSDIVIDLARDIQSQLNNQELSSAEFIEKYALGVSFIQPGQVAQQVNIDIKNISEKKPKAEEAFWDRFFGFGIDKVLAAGLELSTTAAVPQATITSQPTPTTKPTLSPEQLEQLILDQFVSNPLYDQYIEEHQIPKQATISNYKLYTDINGETYVIITLQTEPNSLPPKQQGLVIPAQNYLVKTDESGKISFEHLPYQFDFATISKSAVEYATSQEFKRSVDDYLNAMDLAPDAVMISQTEKEKKGKLYSFLTIESDQQKLNELQKQYQDIFIPTSFAIFDKETNNWRTVVLKDSILNDINVGTEGSGWLRNNSKSFRLAKEQVEIVMPTYPEITWKELQPTQDRFDETKLRRIIREWQAKGFKVILPTIFSTNTGNLPEWLIIGNYSNSEIESYIYNFISKIVQTSYEEGVDTGIIISEPFLPIHRLDDFFFQRFKDYSYIRTLVLAAKETQPLFKIIANDTDNHSSTGLTTSLTAQILQENPEIDFVGIEAHLGDWVTFTSSKDTETILEKYNRSAIFTEHDINMRGFTGDLTRQRYEQARLGLDFLTAARNTGVNTFIFWGLDGRVSWLKNALGQEDSHATLFDEFYKPTPYFYTVIHTLLK